MYKRILLPTDGSAGMDRVIDHAADLAAEHGALVHALYVVDAGSFTSLPMETSWEGISDLLHEEGQEALDEVVRLVGDSAEVERIVVEGAPHEAIVDHAFENDCDLIVMGTHGRGGLDRLLLGSVAERVVRTSTVPVLTIQVQEGLDSYPPTGERERDEGDEPAH
jgi:nucleotide-binding universal stress UspA family protein